MIQRGNESEQHRRECEARHVMGLPEREQGPYLDATEKIRGKAKRFELSDEMARQYKTQQKKMDRDRSGELFL